MRGHATRHRRNAVLAAVKEDGHALQYAHKDLKKLKKTKKRKKEKDEEDIGEGSAAGDPDIEAAKFKMRMERTPATLPDGYSDTSGNIAKVWKRSRTNQATQVISEVVRRASAMQLRDLPPSQGGLYKGIPYAMVAGSFNQPQFVSGILHLVPGAQKQEENVGASTQFYYVVSAQKQSIEFKIADTTFTLSTGDHFFVPAHNKYGLHNYSSERDAVITFVVIKSQKA